MELLERVGIIAIVVVIVFSLAVLIHGFITHKSSSYVSESDALSTVMSDIKLNNPSSNVTLLSIKKSNISNDTWSMSFRVINYQDYACPTLEIENYNYPALTLVPSVINVYTSDCKIFVSNPCYVSNITSYPILLACLYHQNDSELNGFINTYGYHTVKANPKFYKSYVQNNKTYEDVWFTKYYTANSTYNLSVLSDFNGVIIDVSKS